MGAMGLTNVATEQKQLGEQKREAAPCPFCKSKRTECIALFGPVLLTSQYYCKDCHSAFEVVKD
jgi:transposase-like protein